MSQLQPLTPSLEDAQTRKGSFPLPVLEKHRAKASGRRLGVKAGA